jgi:hypothetical protein
MPPYAWVCATISRREAANDRMERGDAHHDDDRVSGDDRPLCDIIKSHS